MLIGVKKRFVFVANSKNASTAITRALVDHAEIQRGGNPQRKHIYLRDALVEYDFLFGNRGYGIGSFFTFGVMRDPVDWITSWFRYRKGQKVADQLPEEMTFAEFWALDDWNRTMRNGKPRLQKPFFTDTDGKPIVDYIIPYEDIDNHFGLICEALRLNATLRPENVSKLKAESVAVSDALRSEMREFYAEDYALRACIAEINGAGLAKLSGRRKLG